MFMSDWLKLISKKPSDGYKRISREWEGGGQDLPNYHLLRNDIRLAMVRTITSFLYQKVFM